MKALQGDPYGSTIKCTQNIYRTHMYGCKGPRFFSTGASTTSVPGRSQYRGGSLVSVPGRGTGWSKHKMCRLFPEYKKNIHKEHMHPVTAGPLEAGAHQHPVTFQSRLLHKRRIRPRSFGNFGLKRKQWTCFPLDLKLFPTRLVHSTSRAS